MIITSQYRCTNIRPTNFTKLFEPNRALFSECPNGVRISERGIPRDHLDIDSLQILAKPWNLSSPPARAGGTFCHGAQGPFYRARRAKTRSANEEQLAAGNGIWQSPLFEISARGNEPGYTGVFPRIFFARRHIFALHRWASAMK